MPKPFRLCLRWMYFSLADQWCILEDNPGPSRVRVIFRIDETFWFISKKKSFSILSIFTLTKSCNSLGPWLECLPTNPPIQSLLFTYLNLKPGPCSRIIAIGYPVPIPSNAAKHKFLQTSRFLHRDQPYQKPPTARWRRSWASQLPRPLHSHGSIANRFTTITNFQYRCLDRNGHLLFA